MDRLRDMYGLRPDEAIARDLGRTPQSVRKMADELFRAATKQGPWTADDIQQLKRYLGASAPETIARILGRDLAEVQEQIVELARVQHNARWTREENAELRRLYGTRSDSDLAVIFGRSLEAVERQARKLCLAKDKAFIKRVAGEGATRMPRWSHAELDLLRELYPRTSNLDIAQRLQRSVKSVVSKAHHMGLKKELERLQEMGRENVRLRYQS
ncbi:MAG: hypothetical protein JNN27_19330 [Planctomycetes bacterium]|nr:hypothetical protein [Planctomycetota bacterium]